MKRKIRVMMRITKSYEQLTCEILCEIPHIFSSFSTHSSSFLSHHCISNHKHYIVLRYLGIALSRVHSLKKPGDVYQKTITLKTQPMTSRITLEFRHKLLNTQLGKFFFTLNTTPPHIKTKKNYGHPSSINEKRKVPYFGRSP